KIILLTILLIALVGCAKESAEVPAVTGQVILSLPVNEEYILDTENSLLTWEASRIGIKHTGTVAIKEGSLIRENDEFTKGEFIIDMTTITETKNNQRFLNHIKSKDFFDVDKYPISFYRYYPYALRGFLNNVFLLSKDTTKQAVYWVVSFLLR
ncbi:MAG: YceI family protein, partial [Chloroflexi bacterium]|nr:YceI family protein [Chloroflexota bacterium]